MHGEEDCFVTVIPALASLEIGHPFVCRDDPARCVCNGQLKDVSRPDEYVID